MPRCCSLPLTTQVALTSAPLLQRGRLAPDSGASHAAVYNFCEGADSLSRDVHCSRQGLLLAAVRDPDPVLFFEAKMLYRTVVEDVPVGDYAIPLGEARIARQGADITLVGWGQQVTVLERAVGALSFLLSWSPQPGMHERSHCADVDLPLQPSLCSAWPMCVRPGLRRQFFRGVPRWSLWRCEPGHSKNWVKSKPLLAQAEAVAQEDGIECEVIDLRTLLPWDRDTVGMQFTLPQI